MRIRGNLKSLCSAWLSPVMVGNSFGQLNSYMQTLDSKSIPIGTWAP